MSSAKALLSQSGEDEAVSVNQRALVEKILARYSGEFTLFRELLQNSDDANATHVELHFRSQPGSSELVHAADALPDLRTVTIHSMMVRNDGQLFRTEDWDRLKKIAEGNPDETKVGAFGVGFYSAFSVCDEPVVSSGSKVMGFYWKDGGDQLFVKTATNEAGLANASSDGKPWTTFDFELREAAPMPEPHEFARFLTTCLGFTTNLRTASLHFDGHLLYRVSKTLAPSRPIAMRSNLSTQSPLKILRLVSIQETPLQLRAEVSRWLTRYSAKPKPAAVAAAVSATTSFASKMLAAFSSKPASPAPDARSVATTSTSDKDPLTLLQSTLFLRTVSGTMKVSAPTHFAQEMLRATKKALPSTTQYHLIWTGKDEFDASQAGKSVEEEEVRKVFVGLLSDLKTNGRVFIGFPTFQTSGNASSIAARFITTVERESLDFQARTVADWNRQLLGIGGILARTVWETEMEDIGRLYQKTADADQHLKLQQRALHLMQFFTFVKSTPQEVVSSLTEASFFASEGNSSLTLISQLGPTPANRLRLPNPALSPFIKSIPIIPDHIAAGAPSLITTLRERSLVRDISLDDVLTDLGAHPLSITEAQEAFKWWLTLAQNRSYNSSLLSRLKDAAMLVVPDPDTKEDRVFPLGAFKFFLNPKTVPTDMPLPVETLPFDLTKSMNPADLVKVFAFGELGLVDLARHVVSPGMIGKVAKAETNVLVSPHFAEKVLITVAKGWNTLSAQRQKELAAVLSPHAFLPTRTGPKLAADSYFPSVVLFEDLPIVTFPSGVKMSVPLEKLLLEMGVRRHVELQLVFTRLLGAEGGWSHIEVVRYLVSVKDNLTSVELDRLRKTAWLPREGEALVDVPATADGAAARKKVIRHVANTLYEPTEQHRALGLPVLAWTVGKWRTNSDESKMLFDLGLLKSPPVEQILQIASLTDDVVRQAVALDYFLTQYATVGQGYSLSKHSSFPFVPAVKSGQSVLARPTEVFSNPEAASLGFAVLADRLQAEATKLKIARDPPSAQLVAALLMNPPREVAKAKAVFAYLSTRISGFSSSEISSLSRTPLIPVGSGKLVEPTKLYFSASSHLPPGLKDLFHTVPDFGLSAKPFLVAVGVKESPSTAEIATMVITDPAHFYDASGSAERYMSVLRMLAINFNALPSTLRSKMRLSAFFLGMKRIPPANRSLLEYDSDDDEASGSTLTYEMARPGDLAINDDPPAMRVFQAEVLQCPPEEALETLAEALGAPRLSSLVTEHHRTKGESDQSKRASELHRVVSERTVLFLSERRAQFGKAELKHDATEWIQEHLQVCEVRSIELVRTLKVGRLSKQHSQAASAFARNAPTGLDVQLFVAQDLEVDFFEVASGLCRLLLKKQRPNDALLLMNILSTSLKMLSRRGFNVERILASRKAEREAADARLREERAKAQEKAAQSLSPDKLQEAVSQLQTLFPDADPNYLANLLQRQEPPRVENAANAMLVEGDYPRRPNSQTPPSLPPVHSTGPQQQAVAPVAVNALKSAATAGSSLGNFDKPSGFFSNIKRQLGRPDSARGGGGDEGLRSQSTSSVTKSASDSPLIPKPPSMTPRPSGGAPTSTEAVRSNVRKAINAARPETGLNISNEVQKTAVKESEGSYCDASGGANLSYVTDVGGLRFYLERGIPNASAFVEANNAVLHRFVLSIVTPIGQVFGLDPRSLHIFYDRDPSPLIAFNRGGSIYLNLRFYQAWHDKDVLRGDLNDALISTYHSVAHEIAHNLVKPHDSEFSYYFSSICEEYFQRMAQLLGQVTNGQ